MVGMYLDAPRRLFLRGLATTRLLAIDVQIDAQNAPVDMLQLTFKMA